MAACSYNLEIYAWASFDDQGQNRQCTGLPGTGVLRFDSSLPLDPTFTQSIHTSIVSHSAKS